MSKHRSLVYDVANVTELQVAAKLSNGLGLSLLLKREDMQPVHSFKLRGAYNKMAQLTEQEKSKGVIAASAGNHAQGVALSAQKLGIDALIVMPKTTPDIKVEAVKSYGAQVILQGDNYTEAYEHCMTLMRSEGRTFVHPFDDQLVIDGQGTIGKEILDQNPDVTHVFVPVGGGGLLAGVAEAIKSARPDVQIIGIEPEDSSAMHDSLKANKRIVLDHIGIFADGVAVKQVGELTFAKAKKYVDQVVTVDNDHICAAIKAIFEDTRSIVEPAGALAVAGVQAMANRGELPKDSVVVAICSGANMSFERLQFIAERTLLGSGQEAIFAVRLPEVAGALSEFCSSVVNGYAITEFNYRLNSRTDAYIFVGIGTKTDEEKTSFVARLKQQEYIYYDLSLDDLAKEHIRHMIGGVTDQAHDERLYVVQIPERPGALNDFLHKLGQQWNISLFHYRGQGGDQGSVLIGFEARDVKQLNNRLSQIGYEFEPVDSKAAEIFVGSAGHGLTTSVK